MSAVNVSVPFFLSSDDQMHLLAQYMEKVPSTDLDRMSRPKLNQIMREVLCENGYAATKVKLPDAIELKKFDYRARLKGLL